MNRFVSVEVMLKNNGLANIVQNLSFQSLDFTTYSMKWDM